MKRKTGYRTGENRDLARQRLRLLVEKYGGGVILVALAILFGLAGLALVSSVSSPRMSSVTLAGIGLFCLAFSVGLLVAARSHAKGATERIRGLERKIANLREQL
jgi:hypothetical protein